jgi:hypothetical protein
MHFRKVSQTIDTPLFPQLILITKINIKKGGKMQENQSNTDSSSNMFLTGVILLANLDYSGLADYAVKALVGGVIWMTFRIAGDYISERIKKR